MKKSLLLLLLVLSGAALAEEELPVKVKADYLKYSESSRIVTATGSVEIKLEEVTIYSDHLVMDTKTNIVTAEGHIILKSQDYDAQGTALTYRISDEVSSFSGFRTTLAPSTLKGNLYLEAERTENEISRWTGTEGDLTTCDYAPEDAEHYLAAARRVEYYPDEKLVGYSVTFYIGRVPVLWAPYIVYDLKRKRKRNWSFGHNEVEGDFIKSFWDYPSGVIMMDMMEKKGWGKGLEHNYDLKKYGAGTLYLYNIVEPTSTTDWVYKLNHSVKPVPESTLSLSHQYYSIYQIPAGRLEQTQYSLGFNHQKGNRRLSTSLSDLDDRSGNLDRINFSLSNLLNNLDTSYGLTLDRQKVDPFYIRASQRFSHRQPLFNDATNLSLNANYSNNIVRRGDPGDEKLDTDYQITNRGSFYTLSVSGNYYFDLDRGLYRGDENYEYLERQPEISLALNPYDLKLFSLSPTLGYGYYREVHYVPQWGKNRDFATGRYSASLNANKSLPLPVGSNFSFGLGVNQYLYQPGDQLYSMTEQLSLSTALFNCFRNGLTFNRGLSEGNTPFFFDRLGTRYSHINDSATLYYQDYISLTVGGGFNYETMKHFNYDYTVAFKPHPIFTSNFRSSYDIENRRWLDMQSTANLTPFPFLTDSLSLLSDLNTGQIKSGSNQINLELFSDKEWANHWKFMLGQVYNPANQQFKTVDLMIVKDLHCWDVKYTYSDYRKEFSLTFTLKALPGEPIGYTEGRGFYFDSFEKALKEEFEGGPAPQRY